MLTRIMPLLLASLCLVCASNKESPTKLTINNTNGAPVTTVTVTSSSDASKVATFTSIGANMASSTQEIAFSGTVNVTCSSGCGAGGSVNLTSGQSNTLTIPGLTVTTASSGGGGW